MGDDAQTPDKKPGRKYRFDAVAESLATAARLYGVKALAAHLDPSGRDGYLQSKLTTTDSSPHLMNLDDAIGIMVITGDLTPLRKMADLFDMHLVPNQVDPAPAARSQRLLGLSSKFGKAVSIISDALKDGRLTPEEHHEIAAALVDLSPDLTTCLADKKF